MLKHMDSLMFLEFLSCDRMTYCRVSCTYRNECCHKHMHLSSFYEVYVFVVDYLLHFVDKCKHSCFYVL